MTYKDNIIRAMDWLSQFDDTIYVGQGVGFEVGGTFMSSTLNNIAKEKRLEFPVTEQLQMQFATGLAIKGACPISIFPRQNFLLYGVGDLVNFTDKLSVLCNGFNVKMLIRTALGTTKPTYPGIQHSGHYIDAFRKLLTNIDIYDLNNQQDVISAYKEAYSKRKVSLLVEYGDLYNG